MKSLSFLCGCLLATGVAFSQSTTLNLMPYPQAVVAGTGQFRLSPAFSIGVDGPGVTATLVQAANRARQRLNQRTLLYFTQETVESAPSASATMTISVQKAMEPAIGADESYRLVVEPATIRLTAPTTLGALHGLETLIQLVTADSSGYFVPTVTITDAPRFRWRGLMVDVARHFIEHETLKRNLDAMAAVKMNVLHLHLTDDEGFRVESKLFPKLHERGANGRYYTQTQLRELVEYARQRGILIVPEFDLPGHSQSWFAGYPELASLPGPYQPGKRFKLDRSKPFNPMALMQLLNTTPSATLDPTKESVYQFLDKFVGEMKTIFPAPYMHIGADENNGVAWKQNPAIVAFMQAKGMKDTHALQAYFVRRTYDLLKKHNRTTVGWEELFSDDLPRDVVVQVWKPAGLGPVAAPMTIADKGNPVLVSRGFYLDYFMPAYIHYTPKLMPVGTPANVLGGEAALWSELVDETTFEGRAWPRSAAIAERFWSAESLTDIDDMYRRLFAVSAGLEADGLNHRQHANRLLSRLANGQDIAPAALVTDVLTPLKGFKRLFGMMGKPEAAIYETSPFGQWADLTSPDSETAYRFRLLVQAYLQTHSEASRTALRQQLMRWQTAPSGLQPLLAKAPLLKPLLTHAQRLADLATAALSTLNGTTTGSEAGQQAIQRAKTIQDEVELAILADIEGLINGKLPERPLTYPLF